MSKTNNLYLSSQTKYGSVNLKGNRKKGSCKYENK